MSFQHLDIATLATWLDQGRDAALVDIRDALSFAQGHIPGSRRLDNDTVGDFVETTPSSARWWWSATTATPASRPPPGWPARASRPSTASTAASPTGSCATPTG